MQFQQLSPAEQRILRSASVAGERFSVWAIATAAEIDPDSVEGVCEGLAERLQFTSWRMVRFLRTMIFGIHFIGKYCTGGSPRSLGRDCTCSWRRGSRRFA